MARCRNCKIRLNLERIKVLVDRDGIKGFDVNKICLACNSTEEERKIDKISELLEKIKGDNKSLN